MAARFSLRKAQSVLGICFSSVADGSGSFLACTFYFFGLLVFIAAFSALALMSAARPAISNLNKLSFAECTTKERWQVYDGEDSAHWQLRVNLNYNVDGGLKSAIGTDPATVTVNGTVNVCSSSKAYTGVGNCIAAYPINGSFICLFNPESVQKITQEEARDPNEKVAYYVSKVYSWMELQNEAGYYTRHSMTVLFCVPVYILGICAIVIVFISVIRKTKLFLESRSFNSSARPSKARYSFVEEPTAVGSTELEGILLVPPKYRHIVLQCDQNASLHLKSSASLSSLRRRSNPHLEDEASTQTSVPRRIVFVQPTQRTMEAGCKECMLYTIIIIWTFIAGMVLYSATGSMFNGLTGITLFLPLLAFIPCCLLTRERSILVLMTDRMIRVVEDWTGVEAQAVPLNLLEDPSMQRACHLQLSNDGSGSIAWELRSGKLYRFGPMKRLKQFHKRLVSKIEEVSGTLVSPHNSHSHSYSEAAALDPQEQVHFSSDSLPFPNDVQPDNEV